MTTRFKATGKLRHKIVSGRLDFLVFNYENLIYYIKMAKLKNHPVSIYYLLFTIFNFQFKRKRLFYLTVVVLIRQNHNIFWVTNHH